MITIAQHPSVPPAEHSRTGDRRILVKDAQVIDEYSRNGNFFGGETPLLSVPQRNAVHALNAFCREMDDIADGGASHALKRALLSDWRCELARLFVGQAQHPVTRALMAPVTNYGLQCEHFLAIIEGAEMDARIDIQAPSLAELDLYCTRRAVAVCHLSMRILGVEPPAAERLAAELGRALQLTNILHDLVADAGRHRLYLPSELLRAHGVFQTIPSSVLADPALPQICNDLAARAEEHYAAAVKILKDFPFYQMRSVTLMLHLHRAVLRALVSRGWLRLDEPVQIPSWRKAALTFRFWLMGR